MTGNCPSCGAPITGSAVESVTLVIHGTLPGLNEMFDASRANYRLGNALKQQAQNAVVYHIRSQLRKVHFKSARIHYTFYEPNRRRDKSNVAAGAIKVIEDALVKEHVLDNDGWKQIEGGVYSDFDVDKANPRIEVTITGVRT